ncbi:hypothetical protein [Selenomonas felix]|uniref:hypothetical protein n=1 Tax=Selenomonas felix TaxID=1944634 RepID=UPI000C8411FD|nr:hypothetical protein [Selenomonas felix]
MNNNPTSILASFSTIKSMVDAKQYQSPYQILAEFVQYVIVKCRLHSFTAIEMKNKLIEIFGFDIPEAVIKTSVRGLAFIKTENGVHYVDRSGIKEISSFEEMNVAAEASNAHVIDLLISFIKDNNVSNTVVVDTVTQEFIAYLLDDQRSTASGRYTDLISQFILKHETDEKIQTSLAAIREGGILYIGLNHNINEIGSVRNELTLFLGTEVLFSLYGYNGEIYRKLAQDLYIQIKAANIETKRISLRYFSDVRKEIDKFFSSAESIVDGKQLLFDTVAMKAIINGCSTSADVRIKMSDFYHRLQYTYGIVEDERMDYYEIDDVPYNLENLSIDPRMYDSIKLISHINKLRKGIIYSNDLDAKFLIVTNTGLTLNASRDQVERVMKEQSLDNVCDYAVSVEKLTNILWYKLGNGLGRKTYPTNVNAVLKARMLLASKISHNISKLYTETKELFNSGEITEAQLASRIIALRKKPITPEELTSETIEDDLDFSLEYLARYEEEVNRNKETIQEKDRLLQDLRDQNDRQLSEKNNALEEKNRLILSQQDRNKKLEAELAEYHRKEEEKKRKQLIRKRKKCLIFNIMCKIIVLVLLVIILTYFCSEVDPSIPTAVGIVFGLIGAIPVGFSFIKKDLKNYKRIDER